MKLSVVEFSKFSVRLWIFGRCTQYYSFGFKHLPFLYIIERVSHEWTMIPWPSSIRRYSADFAQQDKEFRLLRNETGKEIRYERNCTGHIVNLLKRQRQELEAQKELLKKIPKEVEARKEWQRALPVYVVISI